MNQSSFSKLSKKRIPTLIGLFILVIALILGTVFFQQGLGVFTPRATPETTPTQVRITNVGDGGFTVSFLTEADVQGFVRYGTEENDLKQRASDDRDTLTGTIGEYSLHHITLRGLQPNTTYYYVLGTGNGTLFDNNGAPFKIVTARKSGSPSAARTVYGSVTTESGSPAEGAVVYVAIDGAGEMSSLVKNSGGWAVPLSNAKTPDGSAYAAITDDTNLQLFVQGPRSSETAKGTVTAGQYKSEPIPTISYGQSTIVAVAATPTPSATPEPTKTPADPSLEIASAASGSSTASSSGVIGGLTTESESSASAELTVLDLTQTEPATLSTGQPIITGKAAPNVTVTIEVNSETKITQQLVASADGTFTLDIEKLKKELEPGEHTVKYSYTDPTTGEVVEVEKKFFVEPQSTSANLLAQANSSTTPRPTATPSPTPFGSDNPFPISGATNSAEGTDSSGSATSTKSGRTSQPSTASGMPVSGSVGTTMALIFGGMFFIISGLWSFWVSRQYASDEITE